MIVRFYEHGTNAFFGEEEHPADDRLMLLQGCIDAGEIERGGRRLRLRGAKINRDASKMDVYVVNMGPVAQSQWMEC